MGHLGVVLYEYLGEEYPEVLGSILGALKAIVNVIGMPLPAYMRIWPCNFLCILKAKYKVLVSWFLFSYFEHFRVVRVCHKVFFSYCPCTFYLNMLKGKFRTFEA